MRAGTSVQFGDHVPGGCDHDRVEPSRSVGNPSVERILTGGGHIPDMNTTVIKIEVERSQVAVPDGEGCSCFGGVGKAVQLGQVEGAIAVFDVAEDAAGADRGE